MSFALYFSALCLSAESRPPRASLRDQQPAAKWRKDIAVVVSPWSMISTRPQRPAEATGSAGWVPPSYRHQVDFSERGTCAIQDAFDVELGYSLSLRMKSSPNFCRQIEIGTLTLVARSRPLRAVWQPGRGCGGGDPARPRIDRQSWH